MAKSNKKVVPSSDKPEASSAIPNSPSQSPSLGSKGKDPKPPQASTSALVICRNKHWRYISSFHGPWLQLPPEVLESLANDNYNLPRPHPIDPAVFFDILKIRRLVDDATSLSVRAASGVTSSSLTNSHNGNNGLLGNGSALGLGMGGGGGNAKLSRERKHRMREQATAKLSKAYHLDEIASSVATMQSASTLEDVAHLVLQRNPLDVNAKYVHFFHEKIPSRQMAECTSLQPLDEIIAETSGEGEPLRTRAITKIFKEDFVGAAHDFTLALQVSRYNQNLHKAGRQELQLASDTATEAHRSPRWRKETKLEEEDHPNSLETQLLFQRAGVYLTIACQSVEASLPPKGTPGSQPSMNGSAEAKGENCTTNESVSENDPVEAEWRQKRLEARKIVKTNAKRALRDYLAYLSHFDYTPGLPREVTEEFVKKINQAANVFKIPRSKNHFRLLETDANSPSDGGTSDALVPHTNRGQQNGDGRPTGFPTLPTPVVHPMSSLFSSTPPSDIPPYPETSTAIALKPKSSNTQEMGNFINQSDRREALTYHPLLTDALHSLLLCHCLIQTSARELQRHAHMVARLARICDGFPIFQAARSPSRADWVEILRRGKNWIQLAQPWDTLCAPAPLPGHTPASPQKETPEQKQERLQQQAILGALEDDRVHDEASFHAAVAARQRRQEEDARDEARRAPVGGGAGGAEASHAEGGEAPKRWAQDDAMEYPISTERAQAIVRWVQYAPPSGEEGGAPRRKKKSSRAAGKGKGKKSAGGSGSGSDSPNGVEASMADLKVADEAEAEAGVSGLDAVEEEEEDVD